jgi:hypothetical protein
MAVGLMVIVIETLTFVMKRQSSTQSIEQTIAVGISNQLLERST